MPRCPCSGHCTHSQFLTCEVQQAPTELLHSAGPLAPGWATRSVHHGMSGGMIFHLPQQPEDARAKFHHQPRTPTRSHSYTTSISTPPPHTHAHHNKPHHTTTCTNTHTHNTQARTDTHTHTHTNMHAGTRKLARASILMAHPTHTHTQVLTHAPTFADMQAQAHAHAHTRQRKQQTQRPKMLNC